MKPMNLLTISDTYTRLPQHILKTYLDYKRVLIRISEVGDLQALIRYLQPYGPAHCFDYFYVGFQIEQIGKEFDLLRIAENYIVNIELKSIHTGDKMRKQLLRNKYYLTFLKRPVYYFTYVHENNVLYELKPNNELHRVSPKRLMKLLQEQQHIYKDNVQVLFDVTEYLISPLHHTQAFLAGQYFLNSQQSQFKTTLVEGMLGNEQCIALTGDSGTGKTLLLYDVAKTLQANDVDVLIVQSGIVQGGQHLLKKEGWRIVDAQSFLQLPKHWYEEVDVLIIDETQKIDEPIVERIVECMQQYELNAIFAYDPEHFLHVLTDAKHIEAMLAPHITRSLNLTAKFRMHKELLAFIQHFFDMSKRAYVHQFSRITVEYFDSFEGLSLYMQTLPSNWQLLNFHAPFDELQHHVEQLSNKEIDDIAVILDGQFFYDEGRLSTTHEQAEIVLKMLYYHLTRTRKNIKLIIVQNEPLLQTVLQIVMRGM